MTIKNKCENMDAKELRIGNLVTGGSRGKLVVVTAELIKGISDGVCVYNAIPLTEEWLFKLGFKLNTRVHSNGSDCVVSKDLSWIGIYSERMEDDAIFNCPKYVHQLQNLYFCLSGEELKLN